MPVQCACISHYDCCSTAILQLALSHSAGHLAPAGVLLAARTAYTLHLFCLIWPQHSLPPRERRTVPRSFKPCRLQPVGHWRSQARLSHVAWHPRCVISVCAGLRETMGLTG